MVFGYWAGVWNDNVNDDQARIRARSLSEMTKNLLCVYIRPIVQYEPEQENLGLLHRVRLQEVMF